MRTHLIVPLVLLLSIPAFAYTGQDLAVDTTLSLSGSTLGFSGVIAVDTAALRSTLETMTTDTTSLKSQINTVGNSTATIRTDTTTLQTNINTANTSISTLGNSTATIRTDTTTLRTDVSALQSSTGSLLSTVNNKINLSSISATSPVQYNSGTGAFTLSPVSLSTSVTGTLPAEKLVSTVAYTNSSMTYTGANTHTSSETFTGAIYITTSIALSGSNGSTMTVITSLGSGVNVWRVIPTYYKVTADSTVAAGVTPSSTPITIGVTAGSTYYLDCSIIFRTTTTTTGAAFGFSVPAISTISYTVTIPIAVDGTAGFQEGWGTTTNDMVVGTGVEAVNTRYVARAFGMFGVGTTGSLVLMAAAETGTVTNATVGIGTMCSVLINP